jgi:uncharacterized repeat protein (TIGR01451 family)
MPIIDNTTTSSQIVVAGADAFLIGNDLYTEIQHTFNSDLDMTLTSPQGTQVTISTDNGGGNDDVYSGTLWFDQADDPVTDYIYANGVTAGPLVVEEAFGAFYGEDPNGTWTFDIFDDAGGDTGTLSYWDFVIATTASAPMVATDSFTNSTPVAIVDNTTVSSQIVVTGVPTYLVDLNMQTFISHTFASDLDMTLTSPQGTIVTISTDNGGGNDDVFSGTVWDDFGGTANPPGPVTDNIYANLTVETPLVVEEAMAAFYGEDPNGTWTLDIFDDAGGDTGTLNSWSLDVETGTCAPPPQPAITVDKSPATQSIVTGGNANFTITVSNTGDADLINVSVVDPLTASCDNAVGSLNAGQGAVYNCTAVGVGSSYTNVVTVTSMLVTGGPGPSATDSAIVTVNPPTSVSVSGFGEKDATSSAVWLASLLAVILAFGFVLRRKMTNN